MAELEEEGTPQEPGAVERASDGRASSESTPSAHSVPAMPPHPARWLYRSLVGSGAGILTLTVFETLAHVDPGLAVVLGLGGLTHLAIGAYGLRLGPGQQLVHAATNQVANGRIDVALHLLARAEERYGVGAVRREAHLVRARIALERGDPEAALEEANRALAASDDAISRALSRPATWLTRLSALSIRAFCRAVTGDASGARADAAAVSEVAKERGAAFTSRHPAFLSIEGARTLREPIARARLAEAILLAQEGDKGRLRELLAANRALFAEGAGPNERNLIRGLERMLATPTTTAYRRTNDARPADPSADEGWIERVLPDVAPFVRASPNTETDELVAAPHTGNAAPSAPIDWGPAKRISSAVAIWLGLVGMMGVLWFGTNQHRASSPNELLVVATIAVPMLFVLMLIALSAMRVRSLAARSRTLLDVLVANTGASAADTRASLERVAATSDPIIGGQARLALAELLAREGDFEASLEVATRALSPLERRTLRTVASTALIPSLRAARALAHAALGHVEDATREVDALGDDYASRGRAVYSVRLVALSRSGALEEAAKLAEARPFGVALDRPIEVLGELVRATSSAVGLGLADAQHLERELGDPSMRRWIERAAPTALQRFEERGERAAHDPGERRIATRRIDEDTADRQAELEEREQQAEEEAEADVTSRRAR